MSTNMDFIKSLFKRNSSKDEVYAGFFLKENEGSIIFIHVSGESHKILAEKKFIYSNGWENITEDTDQVIYTLETETKQSPSKAIFFIYSHLVDKKTREIRHPYLERIKSLVKNLDFTPLGYIEYHEAVVESLEKKEGSPITAVLVEFDKSTLDIFVYRAGKVIFEENISRTDNLIKDLIPTFEKVRAQAVIPSRIILYDSADLDHEASRITTHSWKEDLFVQTPKVQVLSEHELSSALIKIFLSQIIFEKGTKADIKHHESESHSEKKEVMGFVVGGDIEGERKTQTEVKAQSATRNTQFTSVPSSIQKNFMSLKNKIKLPKMFSNKLTLPLIGLLLIFSSLFLIELFFHKAEVTIYLPSKSVSKKIEVSNLAIFIATDSASFEAEKSTTGKKSIGDKAKGTVTIYNSSLSEKKQFAKGTVLSGPNSLKFTLDSDIEVASASGDASSVTSSTTKGSVTAADIGTESNLSSGTKFTIGGESNSVVIAKNDSAFSGGSKKDIQTVSKKDMDDLSKVITNKASDYTAKQIEPHFEKGTKLLTQLTEYALEKPEFSHELGEEASALTLKSKVAITHYDYKETDLSKTIDQSFEKEKGNELTLKEENIHYKVTKLKKNRNGYDLSIEASVKLTKDANEKELKKSLIGKSTVAATESVKDTFKASGMDFNISDPLPFLKSFMPFFGSNITLKIAYL